MMQQVFCKFVKWKEEYGLARNGSTFRIRPPEPQQRVRINNEFTC